MLDIFKAKLAEVQEIDKNSVYVTMAKPKWIEGDDNSMILLLSEKDFRARWTIWKDYGKPIQEAFDILSVEQREFLLTGMSEEEQSNVFSEEKNDDFC